MREEERLASLVTLQLFFFEFFEECSYAFKIEFENGNFRMNR